MRFEDFRISFKKTENSSDEIYNAITHHSRIPVIGGLFEAKESFDAQQVLDIQANYRAQLELAHELESSGIHGVAAPERTLKLGQQIAATLPANMRMSLTQAAVRARQRKIILRIVLDFHPSAAVLLSIPWELMVLSIHDVHEPGIEEFLLLDSWITIVRQIRGVGVAVPTVFERPLRLEACAAQPAGVPPIELDDLRKAFSPHLGAGDAHWFAANGTVESLYERITDRQPSIAHLICHGARSDTAQGPRYDLLLTHQKGFARRAGPPELGPLFASSANLRLVVLHACHGGVENQTAEQQRTAAEGIAVGLLRRGVPLVVAFQGEITQAAAAVFTQTLYRQLAEGWPLEYAVARGRLAIHASVPQALLDWSLPVVYRGSEELTAGVRLRQAADAMEVAIGNRSFLGASRNGFIGLSLVLFVLALVYAFLLPPASINQVAGAFATLLNLLTCLGIIAPAIIAATYRPFYQTQQLSARVKKRIILTQWAGSYLGYAVGYMNALLFYFLFFLLFGPLIATTAAQVTITVLLACLALVYSYVSMRLQVRSAQVFAETRPDLAGAGIALLLVGVSAAILFGAPYLAHQLLGQQSAFLLQSAPLSFVLGTGIIALVLGLSE